MNFPVLKTTEEHKRYWRERKIDWKTSYSDTWNHSHRQLIMKILKNLQWKSLFEVGCGSGANLIAVVKNFKGIQIGGCDISQDAIEEARRTFEGGMFKVCSGDDIMVSDKAVDVVLTDALLIYVSPKDIKKYVRELKRIARNSILLCEFHSVSWWNRFALKWNTGYNMYNWKNLLEREGFYDVTLVKIPKEVWCGTPWEEFGYIIIANVPKNYDI